MIKELQTTPKCVVELVEHSTTHMRYVKKRIIGSHQFAPFRKEMSVATILGSHPNVIELHDVRTVKDEFNRVSEYQLLYEYCEGGDLYELVARHRKSRIKKCEVSKLMLGVLNGLKALHENCIVHRDLKLENIVLTADGVPKLCDFSFCEWDSYKTELNRTQSVKDHPSLYKSDTYLVGTCGYLAPDLIMTRIATPRTDIFSLGVIFYELFTCCNAFDSKCAVDHVVDPDVLEYPRRCTKNIVTMMKRMMSKQPHQRPKISELIEFFNEL